MASSLHNVSITHCTPSSPATVSPHTAGRPTSTASAPRISAFASRCPGGFLRRRAQVRRPHSLGDGWKGGRGRHDGVEVPCAVVAHDDAGRAGVDAPCASSGRTTPFARRGRRQIDQPLQGFPGEARVEVRVVDPLVRSRFRGDHHRGGCAVEGRRLQPVDGVTPVRRSRSRAPSRGCRP